jgi:hypothetical protein
MTGVEQQELESEIAVEKLYWGKKLLYAAWIVEIIAAFIGLMIAWSMGIQTYEVYTADGQDFPIGKTFDLFLAALPFLMVASVELLKIPFSYLIYINKNKKVKRTFSVVLVLVTLITFETLSLGFERQYANMTAEVDIPRDKLAVVDNKILSKKKRLEEKKLFTIDSINREVEGRRQEIERSFNDEIINLDNRKRDYESSKDSDVIKQKIFLEQDREALIKARDDQIEGLVRAQKEQSKEERIDLREQKKENTQQIRLLSKEKTDLEKNIIDKDKSLGILAIFGGSSDIIKWEARIKNINNQIDRLRAQNTTMIASSGKNLRVESDQIRNEYSVKIDKINQKISGINKKLVRNTQFKFEIQNIEILKQNRQKQYSEEKAEIDDYMVKEKDKLQLKGSEIDAIKSEIGPLEDEKVELENQVYSAYSGTQIYRLARTIYGVERGRLISEERIALVAKVWFGSLAAIVSSMGIFLAFGAFILKHPAIELQKLDRHHHRGSPIKRSFRLMLRALRKRFKEPKIVTKIKEVEVPKEVIKEVPVDKVVFRDIPVEVVKKQVIHVPIYTNDPDLIKFGTTKVKDIMDDE